MATVALTPQTSARGGTQITFSTPDTVDGVTFSNVGKRGILLVDNGSAAPINVTFVFTKTIDGMSLADRVVAVPAGATKAFGPFTELYENGANNTIKVTFSAVATVGAAVIVPGGV